MTDLVEACARALYDDFRNECVQEMVDWTTLPGKEEWRQRARAVIPVVLEKAAEIFDEPINEQAHRLGINPDGSFSPGSWMMKVRRRAILALKPEAQS